MYYSWWEGLGYRSFSEMVKDLGNIDEVVNLYNESRCWLDIGNLNNFDKELL